MTKEWKQKVLYRYFATAYFPICSRHSIAGQAAANLPLSREKKPCGAIFNLASARQAHDAALRRRSTDILDVVVQDVVIRRRYTCQNYVLGVCTTVVN